MERILCGCRECAADHKPEECNGKLVGVQRKILAEVMGVSVEEAICPLHPFRLGKNPNRSWKPSEDQKKTIIERTRAYRLKKKETFSEVERAKLRVGAVIVISHVEK